MYIILHSREKKNMLELQNAIPVISIDVLDVHDLLMPFYRSQRCRYLLRISHELLFLEAAKTYFQPHPCI